MIVEVRNYRIHSGRRKEFIHHFETDLVPELRSHGIMVVGPLLNLEDPNSFSWLRGFPSLEERERMIEAFHAGERWKNGLEKLLTSMVESHDVTLCETTPDMTFDTLW